MITLHGLSHDGLITKQASSSPEFSVGGGNLNTGGTSRCYPNLGGHPSGRKAIGSPWPLQAHPAKNNHNQKRQT